MTGPPLTGWGDGWTYRPTREQLGEAGRFSRTKQPYGYNDLRRAPTDRQGSKASVQALHYDTRATGADWHDNDDRRGGNEPEAFMAAADRVGIRGGSLRTEHSLSKGKLPAEGLTPDELDAIPGAIPPRVIAFSRTELEDYRHLRASYYATDTLEQLGDDNDWEILEEPHNRTDTDA
jgi:hypothetical protein